MNPPLHRLAKGSTPHSTDAGSSLHHSGKWTSQVLSYTPSLWHLSIVTETSEEISEATPLMVSLDIP